MWFPNHRVLVERPRFPQAGFLPFWRTVALMSAPRSTTSPVRVGAGAAFFDLDRTLLSGASGEVFSAAMKTAGLVNRSIPGEALVYRLFNAIGETLPSMALARQGVALAKGKSQEAVQAAASIAAERLLEMVQPLAAALFDEHRDRKSTRLNSSHERLSRMPSSA